MKPRHRYTLTAATLTLTATLTACGSSNGQNQNVSYAPAAYGQQVGNAFDCYYLDSPLEATAMVNAGLCPPGSVPTLMPVLWHEEYYSYYDSPAYYTYVPASYRSGWYTQQSSFYSSHKTVIINVQSKATYKTSTGKTVTGNTIPTAKMTFGSNVQSKPTFGAPPVHTDSAPVAKKTFGGSVHVSSAPKGTGR